MSDLLTSLMEEVRRARIQIEGMIRRGQQEQEERADRLSREVSALRDRVSALERSSAHQGVPGWLLPLAGLLTLGVILALVRP